MRRHAVHQNGEAEQNFADVALRGFLHIMMSTTPMNAMIGEKFSGLSSWISPCRSRRTTTGSTA